ncbi:hypothetical protein [Streptomyces sp. NPDC054940]
MRAHDLTRELAKALDALRWTEKHLMATNEGNAALHCNPKVFYSPLTTQVHEAVLSLERVTADLGGEDTIPVASHREAAERAQQEIERLRGVAGRAYLLADRWESAHGSAMCLVRAAGAELRDELDGAAECDHRLMPMLSGIVPGGPCVVRGPHTEHKTADGTAFSDIEDVRQHYAGPAAEPCTKHRGRAERQRYGCNGQDPADQGPLTGIEVRDPCPHCEDCRLIARTLMDDHVREHHPEITVAVRLDNSAARFTPRPDGGDWPPDDDAMVRPNEQVPNSRRAQIFTAMKEKYLRRVEERIVASPRKHVEGFVDAVMPAVDLLVSEAEQRGTATCDLPHEMEV